MPAGIVDLATIHEGEVITNSWWDRFNLTDEWIVRRTGIKSRRWLPSEIELWTPAAEACRILADRMPDRTRLDALVVVSTSESTQVPAMAQRVAHLAGLGNGLLTFDMNSACTGFVTGATVACSLVDSGQARSVLVCTAEAMSRIANKTDKHSGFLFGDGVAAMLIEARNAFAPAVTLAGSDGSQVELMAEGPDGIVLDGMAVYNHAVRRMSELAIALDGLDPKPDVFVGHQANGRILQAVRQHATGVETPFVNEIETLGNTSSASIPLAIGRAVQAGRMPASGRLGAVAYGAGESWGGLSVSYDLNH